MSEGPATERGRAAAGVACVLAAALLYGTNGVSTDAYYENGGSSLTLLTIRMTFGLVVFWSAVAMLRPLWPGRRLLIASVLLGVPQLGYSTGLVVGFAEAPAALVVLLFYTYPLLVTMGAIALFGERLSAQQFGFVVVGLTGLVLAVGMPADVTTLGIVCGVGAAVFQSMMVLGMKFLLVRGFRVYQIAACTYVIPVLVLAGLLVGGVTQAAPLNGPAIAGMVGFVVFGSIFPFWLFYSGVDRIGPTLSSFLATLEPFAGVTLAYLVLDERLTPSQVVGGVLIVTAAIGLSALALRRGPVPQPAPTVGMGST